MRVFVGLFLGGCGPATDDGARYHAADDDSGDADDSGDTDETASCEAPPDPARSMALADLLARLGAQGCLAEDDIVAASAAVDTFFASGDVWCDDVWRVSSSDGLRFSGTPELVRTHASVPDVLVRDDGAHLVAFNDLTPGLFEVTLRDDPARFFRQGLIGLGGLGVVIDEGDGFADAAVDLHLDAPLLVVDPDLGLTPAGDLRLVYFGVTPDELDGATWDPVATAAPHDLFRATGIALDTLATPTPIVASSSGAHGGADPTVLDLDGAELLFLGDPSAQMVGWTAPDARYPALGTEPDLHSGFAASAPDVALDPGGPPRVYYVATGTNEVRMATTEDGGAWARVMPIDADPNAHGVSVARGPDGTWWLYYNVRAGGCGGE